MTHFIFDCDDVLLDWMGGFLNYVRKCGINPDFDGPTEWDMSGWLGTTPQYARKLVLDFNESSAFGSLDALRNAKSTIWRLKDAGHTCSVLTACGDHRSVRMARLSNLRYFNRPRMGGESFAFDRVDFLPLGSSKFDWLYAYTRNRDPSTIAFVEDNFAHAQSGLANGIRSYCIRKRHNRRDYMSKEVSSVIWINDISEVR